MYFELMTETRIGHRTVLDQDSKPLTSGGDAKAEEVGIAAKLGRRRCDFG